MQISLNFHMNNKKWNRFQSDSEINKIIRNIL